jgi:hypothetical protein
MEIIPLQQTIGHLEYMVTFGRISKHPGERRFPGANMSFKSGILPRCNRVIGSNDRSSSRHTIHTLRRRRGPKLRAMPRLQGKSEKPWHQQAIRGLYELVMRICPVKRINAYHMGRYAVRSSGSFWICWTKERSLCIGIIGPSAIRAPILLPDMTVTANRFKWRTKDGRTCGKTSCPIWKHPSMKTFIRPVNLKESLSKKFMDLYGGYFGDEFPKRVKAYPYIEFYMDKGFQVIGAPTCLGNGDDFHTLPNYWRFIAQHQNRRGKMRGGRNVRNDYHRMVQLPSPHVPLRYRCHRTIFLGRLEHSTKNARTSYFLVLAFFIIRNA